MFPEIDCYLQLRTAGIGESALAEKGGAHARINRLVVGYCAHAGMVDLLLEFPGFRYPVGRGITKDWGRLPKRIG